MGEANSNSPHHINGESALDDNWCHITETVNMLYLAVCQIETTLSDSNTSVDTLTQSFTQLANHTNEVSQQIQGLEDANAIQAFKEDISSTATELKENISESVQAFQFYDRVCQRIDHVARSLEKVSKILSDEQRRQEQDAWLNVQNEIKSSYTMEAERIMFEYIMRGGNVKDALEIYQHHFGESDNSEDDDEIELF